VLLSKPTLNNAKKIVDALFNTLVLEFGEYFKGNISAALF
jgi:hypothetical protein